MNSEMRKAFTLIEVMVTLVILGVIAGIAIPKLVRVVELGYEDETKNQLRAIHAAEQIYFSRHSHYWPANNNAHNIDEINQNLGLHIIPRGVVYNCMGNNTSCFMCTAIRTPSSSSTGVVTYSPLSDTSTAPNPRILSGSVPCLNYCSTGPCW